MWSLLRTLTVRYIGQRWTRSVLVVISIALGVAILVATRSLNETMSETARGAVTPFANRNDLVIVNGASGVPSALAHEIEAAGIAGLKHAWPFSVGRAIVPEIGGSSLIVGVPLDNRTDSQHDLPGVSITWTASGLQMLAMTASQITPVVVGDALARRLADADIQQFHLRLAGHELIARPVGTVHLVGDVEILGAELVFMQLPDAAHLLNPLRPDYAYRINLQLEDGADQAVVQGKVETIVGTRAEVRSTQADNEIASDVTAGLEMGVGIGGAAALVVGLFLVYNALSVSVAERRRDIGILRSSGATRRQIVGLFVGEATLLGAAGAAIGLPLGWGMALLTLQLLRGFLSEVFGVPFDSAVLQASSATLLLAPLAGIATAMVAALIPALQAALEEPADAVRRVPAVAGGIFLALHIALCVLLAGIGIACVGARGYLPSRLGAFAGISVFMLTALVATPLVAGVAGRLLQPIARALFGLEARLAADNLVRSPGRTGVVIAALAAAGSLLVMTSGFVHSTEQTLLNWLDEQIAADLFITSGASFYNAGQMTPMSEAVGDRLKASPGVLAVLPLRLYQLDFRQRIVIMTALDSNSFAGEAAASPGLARHLRQFPRLREPGTVLLSENFAVLYGIGEGDTLTIRGPSGPLDLEVIGVVTDYTWNRGSIIVDRTWFRETYGDDQVDVWDLWLKPGTDATALGGEIVAEGATDGLVAQTKPELRGDITRALNRVYSIAYAQQVVIGMVALLGVASALFISVLQRTRDLGLLRAVGATRPQVLKSVLAEAILMGALGAALGFALGILLEWYVVKILLLDDAGWVFPLYVPWKAAGIVIGSSVLASTAVGLWPAYSATRLRIPEAIAYE